MTIAKNLQECYDQAETAKCAFNAKNERECYIASCELQRAFDRIVYSPASPERDKAIAEAQALRRKCAGYLGK